MAATSKETKEKLNLSLIRISRILNQNNFDEWFIAYGTLLGIVRNNSCIDGDDDIDIICNIKDFQKLKNILIKENYKFDFEHGIKDSKRIIKTKATIDSASIDFYMAEEDGNGNYDDAWEGAVWSNCYLKGTNKFKKLNWKNTTLNLPANFYRNLRKRYGLFWRIPQNNKGNLKYKIKEYLWIIYSKYPEQKRENFKKLIKANKFIYKFVKKNKSNL